MVCMSYIGISHDSFGEYRKGVIKWVFCVDAHKAKNHRYGVTWYSVKMGKICIYVHLKSVNCWGNYQATTFKYPTKLKTQIEV